MASPNDFTYAVVREVIPGTTPATTAFKGLECLPGADLNFTGKVVTSDVMKANRANAAAVLLNKMGDGELKVHGRRDTTVDTLIEGVLGSSFTTNVCKGGSTDFSHTIEKIVPEKITGTSVPGYHRFTGMYVTKWGATVDANSNCEFSFGFAGMNKTVSATPIAASTYTDAVKGATFDGSNVGTITIGGITGIYTSLDLTVEQPRDAIFGLGTTSAVAIGASPSPRTVKITAKMLRNGIAVDAIAGTIVAVSVTFGTGTNNQYTVACPKMLVSVPSDEVSGAAAIVSIELIAISDDTLASDISVTKA